MLQPILKCSNGASIGKNPCVRSFLSPVLKSVKFQIPILKHSRLKQTEDETKKQKKYKKMPWLQVIAELLMAKVCQRVKGSGLAT